MHRLAHAAEHLDGPLDDQSALAGNLRDLRRINRLLGGVELSHRALATLVGDRAMPAATPGGAISVIDVGTGGADIPQALVERAQRAGRELRAVAVDGRPEVLNTAVFLEPGLAGSDGIELKVADASNLPFADRTFDVAHASLVLHHLEPAEAIVVLREMARVARIGVIVNDLTRSRLGLVGAWLVGHLFTRNRFTRHDAPLSVRRAYRPAELIALMAEAGLRPTRLLRGAFGQRYAVVAVPTREDAPA